MKKMLVALALIGNALVAQAQAIVPGELVIYEHLGTGTAVGPWRPYYIVANGTDRDISAFGVTNNTLGNSTNPENPAWKGAVFNKASWDDGVSLKVTSAYFGLPVAVVDSGSFSHNFGDTNSMVNFYWGLGGEAIKAGETSDKFYYNGIWLSEFKAWDTQGNAIYEEHRSAIHAVAVVPEPETYAMLLAGLGLMSAIARRRKSQQA